MGLDRSRLKSGNRSASNSEAPSTGLRKMLLLFLSFPVLHCSRLAAALIIRPTMTAPNRNDNKARRSAMCRIRLEARLVSET